MWNKFTTLSVTMLFLAATPILAQSQGIAEVDRAYEALDSKTRSIIDAYLQTDCEIGEGRASLDVVVALGDRARPLLLVINKLGPPSRVLSSFIKELSQSWQARQRFLESSDARELGEESFTMMKAISREAYEKDQLNAIQAKYRERAMLVLKEMSSTQNLR